MKSQQSGLWRSPCVTVIALHKYVEHPPARYPWIYPWTLDSRVVVGLVNQHDTQMRAVPSGPHTKEERREGNKIGKKNIVSISKFLSTSLPERAITGEEARNWDWEGGSKAVHRLVGFSVEVGPFNIKVGLVRNVTILWTHAAIP